MFNVCSYFLISGISKECHAFCPVISENFCWKLGYVMLRPLRCTETTQLMFFAKSLPGEVAQIDQDNGKCYGQFCHGAGWPLRGLLLWGLFLGKLIALTLQCRTSTHNAKWFWSMLLVEHVTLPSSGKLSSSARQSSRCLRETLNWCKLCFSKCHFEAMTMLRLCFEAIQLGIRSCGLQGCQALRTRQIPRLMMSIIWDYLSIRIAIVE